MVGWSCVFPQYLGECHQALLEAPKLSELFDTAQLKLLRVPLKALLSLRYSDLRLDHTLEPAQPLPLPDDDLHLLEGIIKLFVDVDDELLLKMERGVVAVKVDVGDRLGSSHNRSRR